MDRIDFITDVFKFFGKDVTKNKELLTQYDFALSTKEPIDWYKLYAIVLKETESRILPPPKWFRDKFYRCYKIEEGSYGTPDGTRVRMTLFKDDMKTTETREAETYHISYTLEQMKEYKRKQYGIKFISFCWWDDNKLEWVKV